jgi:O-antigen/teichoic acid export membrane protein
MAFAFASFAVLAIFGLASSVLIARLYGPSTLGKFALALAPTGILMALSSVREQAALQRRLALLPPRHPHVTGLAAAVLAFSTALTIGMGALVVGVGSLVLANGLHRPDLVLPCIVLAANYALFQNPSWNLDMVFSSFRAGRELFAVRLHQVVAYLIAAIALAQGSATVWALVAATALGSIGPLGHRMLLVRRFMYLVPKREDLAYGRQELPELIRWGIRLTPAAAAEGLGKEGATWVLGFLLPVAAVGAYNRAWLLSARLIDVNYRVTEMLFPTLLERRHAADHQGFDRALVDSLRYSSALMVFPAAIAGGAAVGIMRIFGDGFVGASGALAWLLIVPALITVSAIQGYALLSADRVWAVTGIVVTRTIAMLALMVPLVKLDGMTGAAIALVAGYAADVIATGYFASSLRSSPFVLHWPVRGWVGLAAAYGAGFTTSRLIDSNLPDAGGLALALAAGSLAYWIALVAVSGLTAADRQRLGELRRRIRPPRSGVTDLEAPD